MKGICILKKFKNGPSTSYTTPLPQFMVSFASETPPGTPSDFQRKKMTPWDCSPTGPGYLPTNLTINFSTFSSLYNLDTTFGEFSILSLLEERKKTDFMNGSYTTYSPQLSFSTVPTSTSKFWLLVY